MFPFKVHLIYIKFTYAHFNYLHLITVFAGSSIIWRRPGDAAFVMSFFLPINLSLHIWSSTFHTTEQLFTGASIIFFPVETECWYFSVSVTTLSKALSLLGGNYFCSYLINYKCVWCLQHNKDVIWCERGKNRGSCWWWNTSREQFNFCTSNRIIRCPLPEHSQSLTASLLLLNWLILQSALWSTPRMNGRHWRDHQVSACKRCW